jgi:1-aminocyclopropane-1-carboxylate deaminase/D-cysteine desulfhydrase-like pyridoxal-dependent ACC family enzyme
MAVPWADLPRVALAPLPTPLAPAPRFSAAIGADVWIKRDDVGALGLAGNKVRKLEFVLGEARRNSADAIVIVGAEQSNACRAAAAACAQLGLRCVLVLSGDAPERTAGNLLLDRLYGAEVHFAGTTEWAALARAAEEATARLRADGATPFALPVGASSPLGAVGFAVAWSPRPARRRRTPLGRSARCRRQRRRRRRSARTVGGGRHIARTRSARPPRGTGRPG